MTFSLIWSFSRNNWSVKFWSAFLMDLEKPLVANINFLKFWKRTYQTMILWKFKVFLMHKVPLLSSCMGRYWQKNVIFRNILLTLAFFWKTISHNGTQVTSISFEEVTCKVKSHGIFIDSSPIRWKFWSIKFWSAFWTDLEK